MVHNDRLLRCLSLVQLLLSLVLCHARVPATTDATFAAVEGCRRSTGTTGTSTPRDQEPHVPSAASSLSREESSLSATAGAAVAVSSSSSSSSPSSSPSPPDQSARNDRGSTPQSTHSTREEQGHPQHAPDNNKSSSCSSSHGGGGGGPGASGSDDGGDSAMHANSPRTDGEADFSDSTPVDAAEAEDGREEAAAASTGQVAHSPMPAMTLSGRAKARAAKTWTTVRVGVERAIHVRREVKAAFSSELERCLLKATRPENIAVDEGCMQALLAQASRLSAVEACCDCDPHEVVCSKVLKKMMEQDWRTVAKALYVVHRLQRDSPSKEAARFSAFIKEQWAEGAGGLGKHMRLDGGIYAPWLKVYGGYLATRGMHLETATQAFRSWETLTSTRQLRNALTETNALLEGSLALHFADDASSGGVGDGGVGRGEAVRRACCALAFEDVADVRAILCDTGNPPALSDVLGVGVGVGTEMGSETCDERRQPSSSSSPSDPEREVVVAAAAEEEMDEPAQPLKGRMLGQCSEGAEKSREREAVKVRGDDAHERGQRDLRVTRTAETRSGAQLGEKDLDGSGCGGGGGAPAAAAAAALRDVSEDVLEVAKECVAYEDVSGIFTAVYSARYGADAGRRVPAVPSWVRQMATLARLAGSPMSTESSSGGTSSGSASDCVQQKDGGQLGVEATAGQDGATRATAWVPPADSTAVEDGDLGVGDVGDGGEARGGEGADGGGGLRGGGGRGGGQLTLRSGLAKNGASDNSISGVRTRENPRPLGGGGGRHRCGGSGCAGGVGFLPVTQARSGRDRSSIRKALEYARRLRGGVE